MRPVTEIPAGEREFHATFPDLQLKCKSFHPFGLMATCSGVCPTRNQILDAENYGHPLGSTTVAMEFKKRCYLLMKLFGPNHARTQA